jgi:hypothetical protein
MKNYPDNLIVDTFSSHFTENEFYIKYLRASSFRGFYYDSNDRSYGIVLQFLQNNQSRLNLYAIETEGMFSVVEYRISSEVFLIESVAYDKVLIMTNKYKITSASPASVVIKMPQKIEFTLQLLTRNSFFIRFLDSDQYASPINSFKSGLVLARESDHTAGDEFEDILNTNIAFSGK